MPDLGAVAGGSLKVDRLPLDSGSRYRALCGVLHAFMLKREIFHRFPSLKTRPLGAARS